MWVPHPSFGDNQQDPFKQRRYRGKWLTVEILGSGKWPIYTVTTNFAGREIFLVPYTKVHCRAIVTWVANSDSIDDCFDLINRYLSGVVWNHDQPLQTGISVASRDYPPLIGLRPDNIEGIRIDSGFSFVPDPTDADSRMALALHREAVVANLVQYQFLAYFKIINMKANIGAAQKSLINSAIPRIKDHRAIEALQNLNQNGITDIGKYLYEQTRCAIAHAYSPSERIDPDQSKQLRNVSEALPLIRAIAWDVMMNEFKIKPYLVALREYRESMGYFDLDLLSTTQTLVPSM